VATVSDVQVLAAPPRQVTDGDELDHITECHDDDRGLCGMDLTGVPFVDELDESRLCVVCADLEGLHCGCSCGCCDGEDET
jgi:hypothetical protein